MKDKKEIAIAKSNTFIQNSRYDLSAQQQKILLYIMAQIKPTDTALQTYTFDINKFCEACGISTYGGKNFKDIKNQIIDIVNKSFWVDIGENISETFRWINRATINRLDNTLSIELDEKLKVFLIQLKSNYTIYTLKNVLQFKSKYSIRLYEFFKSIQYTKDKPYTASYTVQELYRLIDTTYVSYGDFNKRVLKTATREINSKSDIVVTYETKKNNKREVTDIIFTVMRRCDTQ